MPTVYEILNFNFSPAALQAVAKTSISASMIRLQEGRINKLIMIREELGESEYKEPSRASIQQVFRKFKNIIVKEEFLADYFDKRELKTLVYSLSHSELNNPQIFSKPNELDFVFKTLEISWKDTYLKGLIDCYLKNWETNHTLSAEKLSDFIYKKLRNYDGNRTVLKSLKANMRFFGRNGDVLLGSELALKDKRIKEATKYLSLRDDWFTYPYFSKVIVAYYEKRKSSIQQYIDDLQKALQEHDKSISSKRLVSKLIIQANENEFAALQDKVKSIAVKLVGDPANLIKWTAFENATENEKQDLKQARKILNEWITRQFINVFFEKCINDSRRKRFWLKYAKEITQFRVVGSGQIKRLLLNDNRISEYVAPRFSSTNAVRDSNAALMFIIRNHLFIEFSDEGAFYAYQLSNSKAPSIEETFFYSTSSLKNTSFDWLAYRTGRSIYRMSDEGRLGHNDGDLLWEEVASYWLKNKAGINV